MAPTLLFTPDSRRVVVLGQCGKAARSEARSMSRERVMRHGGLLRPARVFGEVTPWGLRGGRLVYLRTTPGSTQSIS